MEQISRQIHKEEYQRMKEQMIQEDEAKRARGELIVVESEVSYPLFETFLVLGIFLLARSDVKRRKLTME